MVPEPNPQVRKSLVGFGCYRLASIKQKREQDPEQGRVRKEGATIMTSNHAFTGIGVAGMSRTFHAPDFAAATAAASATAATAAPRKRRAAAGTAAASVKWGSI